MNKGDTLDIVIDYTIDGDAFTKDQFQEIELQFENQYDSSKYVKLLLSNGDITWDEEAGKYVTALTQEQTFRLSPACNYQLRVLVDDVVVSSEIGTMTIGDTLSRKVLK